ncbi:N(5)-(carboxyethyl)ornithine synthase [Reichenbachiella ulvae]|uniref:N(5)-(Carboxyethyl)ornithine synthase n=1 Tax=Reichenbachiella ulvae TaxID=2980104 RepID=A0ABT3CU41_9BACT|nr:N(5)-(carboxyethyl)ornithine synthase [Reichenbachiella ulvae]MCV9387152.1 N(5)-(carboxyethyl)ornithine synthase [Reichenbachiella ulvae]
MNTFGVIGTSKKEGERRLPIHPDHLLRLPQEVRKHLIFEKGYGKPFNVGDDEMKGLSGGIASRDEILEDIGAAIIAKPVLTDLEQLKVNGVLWGYPHCAQQRAITQAAIDRKLTLIAFEDMFVWSPGGERGRHTFYKNNEMAGYCAVIHALQLKGIDGHYGNQRKVIIFSFGAVSRGAIYALKAHGFRDITICIQRPDHEVREEILDVHYVRIRKGSASEARLIVVEHDGSERPLTDLISESEIIINGTYQDTNDPIDFVTYDERSCLKKGAIIIDVSCDEGMGFYFAKPTTFKAPMFSVEQVDYYAVDHTPSYLWESASRSISAALVVHLPTLLEGKEAWKTNATLQEAINLDQGVIQKSEILKFQNREPVYPHEAR